MLVLGAPDGFAPDGVDVRTTARGKADVIDETWSGLRLVIRLRDR